MLDHYLLIKYRRFISKLFMILLYFSSNIDFNILNINAKEELK